MKYSENGSGGVCNEILAERERQIVVEGFTIDHDNAHDRQALILAAMAYCQSASVADDTSYLSHRPPNYWPWDIRWWKPKTNRRDLIRAAALIVAAIDRIDRGAPAQSEGK
jgi:hypothetical protein